MKLRQIQFAHAVAALGSFSRAAEHCNATQPTLSNSISQLEEQLGGRLFARTTRKVQLTPFGRYLLPYLKTVLDGRDEMLKAASAFHNPVHKLLRIGFSPLVDAKLLNNVLESYRRRHPDVSIFFKECLLDDLGKRFDDNMIDIAIVPRDMMVEGYDTHDFYSDELFYLPQDDGNHPVGSGPINLANLPDAAIILTGGGCGLNGTLKTLLETQGSRLRAYPGQAATYQAIEEWSELGIGAGILPSAKITSAPQRAIPLHLNNGQRAVFDYEWIWLPATAAQPHIAELLTYIKQTVPAILRGQADNVFPLSGQRSSSMS